MHRDEIANKVADAALESGAVEINPTKPFLWNVGKFMPIYNDNRILLSKSEYRKLVTQGLESIMSSDQHIDYIVGTTTAGIAPAASFAQHIGIPLLIRQGGEFYEVQVEPEIKGIGDVIASTTPWAIPRGVRHANELELPFAYIREKPKDHGKEKQIEGIIAPGQRVVLIDIHNTDSYLPSAINAIKQAGAECVWAYSIPHPRNIVRVDITGKRLLIIEDVLSTAKSTSGEIQFVQQAGGQVAGLHTIYNYDLPEAKAAIRKVDPNLNIESVYNYPLLLARMHDKKRLTSAQVQLLGDWRNDYLNWGERNGFLPPHK